MQLIKSLQKIYPQKYTYHIHIYEKLLEKFFFFQQRINKIK